MEFFADNILLILVIPLITSCMCLCSYVFNLAVSTGMLNRLTFLSGFTGIIFAAGLFRYILVQNIQEIQYSVSIISIDNLKTDIGIYADKLSVLFLLIFMIVIFAVQYYAFVYLQRDKKYPLYLFYLNFLFICGIGFFLSTNLLQSFVFGEFISIICYLMINLNFEKSKTSNSSKRFFIINKIGDTLFLTGIIILVYFSLTYPVYEEQAVLSYLNFPKTAADLYVYFSDSWFYITCLLLLCGIIVKSAQIPFHTWLIDAKEGLIPVNTLINSVVMTGCGVFLGLRLLPLFELSASVMNTIIYTGLLTALLCGFFAIFQNNIKKMLSYSTSSQFGIMFAAVGLNIPSAAVLYFLVHSFSKSVLFLSAGNLYQLTDKTSFNMTDFRCSGRQYPVVAYSYFIAVVALSGLFFAGATVKDMITDAFSASLQTVGICLFVLVLFINSLYLFKSYFMIFEGGKDTEKDKNLDFRLYIPVVFLVTAVVLTTFFPQNIFEYFDKYPEVSQELLSENLKYALTLTAILAGAFIGGFAGIKRKEILPKYIKRFFVKGFYLSEIFSGLADNTADFAGNFTKNFDKYIINGIFNIPVHITKLSGWITAVFQNGNLQSYVMYGILFISLVLGIIGIFLFLFGGGV